MKIKSFVLLNILLLCLMILNSCSVSREQEVEGDINAFRSWINMQAHDVAERSEQSWQRAKEEFRQRTEAIDSRKDQLSEELLDEYRQLQEEFRKLDEERSQALARRATLADWEQRLLGSFADKSTITRNNIVQVYQTFIENVRERHSSWSTSNWQMAKQVLERLDERKSQIAEDLPSEEEVKIKALQMEFSALENSDGMAN